MKTITKLTSICALLGAACVSHAQVLLQDFSAVISPTTFFYGTWEATGDTLGSELPNAQFLQGNGVYDITGATATNSNTSRIEFFFETPASIGQNSFLSVTAQALALNAATSFQVMLIDTNANTAFASFDAASFLVGAYSTQVVAITMQGSFNPSSIDSMIISGAIPGGTARFNFSFDSISAVSAIPEPATYAALAGLLALGLVAYRRRQAVAA